MAFMEVESVFFVCSSTCNRKQHALNGGGEASGSGWQIKGGSEGICTVQLIVGSAAKIV
jgi:hypothetical protein